MTQIIDWLNQHNINVVNAIVTVAILFFASIIILILSRFFNRWLTDLQGRLNLTDETNFIIIAQSPQFFGLLPSSSF